ncbi:MBL fold metallo-hydrolase [Candidatus Altiarchaeota archaeon]
MNSITILGSGGGRFVILTQKRRSGGLWMDLDGVKICLDPGPGALVRALDHGLDPGLLDAVFSSHKHVDHYNDVEVMVEAMTHGFRRDHGILVIAEDVAEYISEYHRQGVKTIIPHPGDTLDIKGLQVDVIGTKDHVNGLGFRFATSEGVVTYAGDTGYSDGILKGYENSRILILNTIFPRNVESKTHLTTNTASQIAEKARPEMLVISHFGMKMIDVGPEEEAAYISKETGVKTIAANDGMMIRLDGTVTLKE